MYVHTRTNTETLLFKKKNEWNATTHTQSPKDASGIRQRNHKPDIVFQCYNFLNGFLRSCGVLCGRQRRERNDRICIFPEQGTMQRNDSLLRCYMCRQCTQTHTPARQWPHTHMHVHIHRHAHHTHAHTQAHTNLHTLTHTYFDSYRGCRHVRLAVRYLF